MKYITCTKCEETFPATDEYFRRNRRASTGFQSQCKACAQAGIKEHYIPFTQLQLERRGEVGVKCPLYAPKCGKCIDVEECWRLDGIERGSEGSPFKKLRKNPLMQRAAPDINRHLKAKKKRKSQSKKT